MAFFSVKRFTCADCYEPIEIHAGFVFATHKVECPNCKAMYTVDPFNRVTKVKAGEKMERPEPRKDGPMEKLGECMFLKPDLQGNLHCVEGGCYHDIPGRKSRMFKPFSSGGVFHEGKKLLRCCAACVFLRKCIADKTACAAYV